VINVLIVGDVRLHRDGLACLLDRVRSIRVAGAVDVEGASPLLSGKRIDIVLVDANASQGLKRIASMRRSRRVRIVAVGIREVESEVLACAAAGIDGYVPLGAGSEDLVAVLTSVMRRELVCSPKVAASLFNCAAILGAVGPEPLTVRELEVIDLMNSGLSNKEIARRLGIEASTTKNHVQNILQKLNVHRRGQAAAKLRGLIRDRLEPADALAGAGVPDPVRS
jgi:two-component system, NarL family, nitrate/nitrite response regulator NarL